VTFDHRPKGKTTVAEKPDWSNANVRRLAGLMQVDQEALWSETDLGAILQHQLDSPLDLEPRQPGPSDSRHADRMSRTAPAAICTLRELFDDAQPPIELLERTKQFAKDCRSRADGPVPDEVATVIYLAAIVAARSKCGRAISQLDDVALRHALDWALSQPWLDAEIRDLLAPSRATLTIAEE
jgi:hypothetical protein